MTGESPTDKSGSVPERLAAWFHDYTARYDLNDGNIALKAEHCVRVAAECGDIARHSGFSERDAVLARGMGLLHDVGRFEQYRRYRTFADRKSVDHALLAVEIVNAHGVLAELPPGDRTAVLDAISHHNALRLPPGLGDRTLAFSRLLRDADKLDIYRVTLEHYWQPPERRSRTVELDLPEGPELSGAIVSTLMEGRSADYRDLRTVNDFKLLQMGWVFDMHYPRAFELIRERGCIDALLGVLPRTDVVVKVYGRAIEHLRRKCVAGHE